MRKETITKYEKEFLAWCKNESVLLGAPTSMHDKTLIWREVRDFNDWEPLDTVYVLNDSYSHYRKALAEGKTVQFNFGVLCEDFPNIWKDLDTKIGFIGYPEEYRVKPEEPQFKVGDWVRMLRNGNILQWTQEDSTIPSRVKEVKLWKPQPGEWCWDTVFGLVKVINETTESGNPCYLCRNPWKKVEQKLNRLEPFIGKLPTHF